MAPKQRIATITSNLLDNFKRFSSKCLLTAALLQLFGAASRFPARRVVSFPCYLMQAVRTVVREKELLRELNSPDLIIQLGSSGNFHPQFLLS